RCIFVSATTKYPILRTIHPNPENQKASKSLEILNPYPGKTLPNPLKNPSPIILNRKTRLSVIIQIF
ncbi:MAG TPA: hypothetical protein VKI61_17965, partial [Chitinophagaceae bacterium]|nr:hypothetical protein [Chitinophagaceae bacterium]